MGAAGETGHDGEVDEPGNNYDDAHNRHDIKPMLGISKAEDTSVKKKRAYFGKGQGEDQEKTDCEVQLASRQSSFGSIAGGPTFCDSGANASVCCFVKS